ncbi:hypothetical protein [Methylotuvimicrobium alcaliphilum]|nr:hypothetical protein [Methylotuvimicrobium alcaliphilum]
MIFSREITGLLDDFMLMQAGIDRLLFRITMDQYGHVGDNEMQSNDYIKHQSYARSFDELGTESKQLN